MQEARKDLELLIDSEYPIISLETWEEGRATELLGLVAGDLHVPLYVWTVTEGMARAGGAPIYNTLEPAQVLAQIGTMDGNALYLLKDFHKYFNQDVIVRKLRDLAQRFRRSRRAIVITSPAAEIPAELEKEVAHFVLDLPEEPELARMIQEVIRELTTRQNVKNELNLAQQLDLARGLRGLTGQEARRVLKQAILEAYRVDARTLERIRDAKSRLIREKGILEFVKREGGMETIGGLERLKAWLEKRRAAFSPEAAQYGLDPPRGILIMGVQGCGKSLCAKAVAREWRMPLVKLDTSRLFEKYIGESEKNLRQSLQVAEAVSPCVLWIDEIEKMFPHSGGSGDADAGLSLRLFGNFLTWMQERKAPVFIVATSNDISALPPELVRKGRFDEIFFVDLPDAEERKAIFSIHLRRHKQDPAQFDLNALASATAGFSGAEIEQAVASGLYAAFDQKTALDTGLILKEVRSTYPLSVTLKEKIEGLREWAQERAVPAN